MAFKSRWTTEQKIIVVMESLNTNVSIAELCRKYNVTPNAFYSWKEKFLRAGKLGLSGSSSKKGGADAQLLAEVEKLKKLIGELTIANDALKKALTEGGKRR